MNDQSRVPITGNTYPVRTQLYKLGGRWDAEAKAWLVPADKEAEAKALVEGAPVTPKTASSPLRHTHCKVCGARGTRYAPIYRSGECRDCYEERKMGY